MDLVEIEKIGQHLEGILQKVPGTHSVFGERVSGGYFVDFDLNREQIVRYGLTIDDVQQVIMTAIGGDNVLTTVEGRERYPINIRYPRGMRDDIVAVRKKWRMELNESGAQAHSRNHRRHNAGSRLCRKDNFDTRNDTRSERMKERQFQSTTGRPTFSKA